MGTKKRVQIKVKQDHQVSPYSYRSPYLNLKLPLDLRTLGDHQILLDHQTPYTILSFEITLGPSHTWEKLRSEPQAAHVFFVFKKKGFFFIFIF